jgi:hypothetical protein
MLDLSSASSSGSSYFIPLRSMDDDAMLNLGHSSMLLNPASVAATSQQQNFCYRCEDSPIVR